MADHNKKIDEFKDELANIQNNVLSFLELQKYNSYKMHMSLLKASREDGENEHLSDTINKIKRTGIALAALSDYLSFQFKHMDSLKEMSMAERLILGREDLCSSISKDLHDSVASDLAGLKMNADFFEMLYAKGKYDKLSELLPGFADNVAQCESNLYRVIFGVPPKAFDGKGLAEAVKSLCEGLQEKNWLKVAFDMTGSKFDLPLNVEVIAYHIVEEALNNVRNHSGQDKADVNLHYDDEAVSITIEDYGEGFDMSIDVNKPGEEKDSRKHYGLLGMKERADSINASLEVSSSVGHGTKVMLVIPKQ